MNTMNVHDLHFDEDFLAFARHDNSSIGNVQVAYQGEPNYFLCANNWWAMGLSMAINS